MSVGASGSEAWKKMVLRSMAAAAWLTDDAQDTDVIISSRSRFARSLRGFPFPECCTEKQLFASQNLIESAALSVTPSLEIKKRLTEAERDFLLGSRLLSVDFQYREPARSLVLDASRRVALMVNEEDHLRLQALTGGLSTELADQVAESTLKQLDLEWAWSERWGHLNSSPINAGEGRRRSVLAHLAGLAWTRRLASVVKALEAWGLEVRGLYGESSRAVGHFFQISSTQGSLLDFRGATAYLLAQERESRREVQRSDLIDRTKQARDSVVASSELSMADALKALSLVRWAAEDLPSRAVDEWIATMEVHGTTDAKTSGRHRAVFVRDRIEPLAL